jgi:copper homeostasis protein
MRRILLEVCIASAEDAVIAQSGGADRLELNAALSLGGLTPSLGTLLELKQACPLPVMVLLRPRVGGFCYSESDFRVLRRDLDLAGANGADGLVFGVLNADGTVDSPRCRALVEQAGGLPCVFHRAFDVTPDPFAALETLVELGFRRVLTSGQEETAYNGAALLRQLIERARGRIEVLPASGINSFTVADVVARTGCDQVHASLRGWKPDPSLSDRRHVRLGAVIRMPEDLFEQTRASSVKEVRAVLDGGVFP